MALQNVTFAKTTEGIIVAPNATGDETPMAIQVCGALLILSATGATLTFRRREE